MNKQLESYIEALRKFLRILPEEIRDFGIADGHDSASFKAGLETISGNRVFGDIEEALRDVPEKHNIINWEEAFHGQDEAIDWLFEPFIERGTVTSLYSDAGIGKSLLSLDIALQVVRDHGTVVYVDDENTTKNVVSRLKDMGAVPGELDKLVMCSAGGLHPLDTKAGGQDLIALAASQGADLVVLDTTMRMIEGGENDSDTFHHFGQHTVSPLKSLGFAVLRLDHAGKDASRGQRGSSAKGTVEDSVWRLSQEKTIFGECLKLINEKDRAGHAIAKEIEIERHVSPVLWHEWKLPGESRFDALVKALDKLNVIDSVGRPTAEKALRDAGITFKNSTLAEAVRFRKNRTTSKPF
jgi:Fe2+ transport system protein FeoA